MSAARNTAQFDALLQFLRESRGFDSSGYKRPSLTRRVDKRMDFVKARTYEDYLDYLEVHPEEFEQLFDAILINVTSFFRDPPAWDLLQREVIPRILRTKQREEAIRIWSAGCASGEEVYTLVMVFAESLGIEAAQQRVKIYATDVDEDALTVARKAAYGAQQVASVPEELRNKYFEKDNSRYAFRPELRRGVIFGRHDLIQDAPISHLDLLVCRNTLMYFNAEAQTRILAHFHFALNRPGFLFLGKAELLLTHGNLFLPLDMKSRIFSRVDTNNVRDRMFGPFTPVDPNQIARQVRLRDLAFDSSLLPRLVVNHNGILVLATQKARTLFGLIPRDIGRPLQELEIYSRPADLRPLIEQAYAERRTVILTGVERRFQDADLQYLDVHVSPLSEDDSAASGVSVTYVDVTRVIKLQEELQRAHQEIETSSEELQSTNEELETTNEELQSTNEELKTMNEELQSTNEELNALNDELRLRLDEIDRLNVFQSSILSTMRAAVVVLDNDLLVQLWNFKSEDLWGLRAQEVTGRPFMSLDLGLPVDELKRTVRLCLTGAERYPEIVVSAVNRRGKSIQCRVTCSRLTNSGKDNPGVILIMEVLD